MIAAGRQIHDIIEGMSAQVALLDTDGAVIEVESPNKYPNPAEIKQIEEPIIDASVITREEYLGEVLKLLEEKE